MLILDNGLVKITDFGIAIALNSTQLTQTNSVMGSVHYLPPEQAAGKGATVKSDIYSLGIMMFELITGKLPFKGENAVEIALKQMKEPIPSIKSIDPTIPQCVENIIIKSCAKNPRNRYNSVREMYNDICTCLDETRKNEKKVILEYPEFDEPEVKAIKKVESQGDDINIKSIEKKDKKKNKLTTRLISIISIFIILGVLFIIFLPKITAVPDVKIPDVSNKSIVAAEEILRDAGFNVNVEVKEISSDTIEEDLIVKTSPDINRTVKKGTTITLYKSIGSEKIEITDYTGSNIYEIKARLELKGLNVLVESMDVDDVSLYKDKEDIIIDQDPKEGTLNKDDQIILYYPNVAVYPDLTAYTLQEVQDFATKYELELYVDEFETTEFPEGTILSQNRKQDSLIVRGADLTVQIAKTPTTIPETE
jgi:serine/threonine-protein kinase